MQQRTSMLTIGGQAVPLVQCGSGDKRCLVVGAGSLYYPGFSPEFLEMYTFYNADPYFVNAENGSSRVDPEKIQRLTLDDYLEYCAAVYDRLNLNGERIAVMGFSALGLVAYELGQRYPDKFSHVIMIATPSTTQGLQEEQMGFIKANYNRPGDSKKWERFVDAQEVFKEEKKHISDPGKLLAAEVFAGQLQYSIHPESKATLEGRWGGFNTFMRTHFFSNKDMIVKVDLKSKGRKICLLPVLMIFGEGDGVAPFGGPVDLIQKGEIKGNISYAIMPWAAHDPHKKPDFVPCLKAWLRWVEKNPGATQGSEEWLDEVYKHKTENKKEDKASIGFWGEKGPETTRGSEEGLDKVHKDREEHKPLRAKL